MQRVHPLKVFYDIIDQGGVEEKVANLPEFPRILEFEITNHCNFQCLMCKTGTHTANRDRGYMAKELFQKILDEVEGKGTAIKFVGQGEPLMHPEAIPFIHMAAHRGIVCHLTTNGTYLTADNMEALIQSGLASIKFSFQGVDGEGYREMRQKDDFEELREKIKQLYRIRGERELPFITVCTSITDETPDQVQAFRDAFAPYCDKVEVGFTTLEFIEADKIKNEQTRQKLTRIKQKQMMNKVRYPCCNQVFDTLAVHWDGTVTACCADTDELMALGNLRDHTISYYWNCEKEQGFRDTLAKLDFDSLPLCKHCYDFMGYMKGNDAG